MTDPSPELLGRWLQERLDQGRADAAPPAGLDPEVIEAVDALRPDLAPVPAVLEAALAELAEGPLADPVSPSEEAAAQAFAAAFDGPLTEAEAAALDGDAFATLAALAPERLPVPALDLGDAMLGGEPAPPAEAAGPGPQTLPPSIAPEDPPAPAANRRRWLLPAVSAAAMAAAVLLVVRPSAPVLMSAPSPYDAAEAPVAAPVDAPAVAAEPYAEPAGELEALEEEEALEVAVSAPPPPASADPAAKAAAAEAAPDPPAPSRAAKPKAAPRSPAAAPVSAEPSAAPTPRVESEVAAASPMADAAPEGRADRAAEGVLGAEAGAFGGTVSSAGAAAYEEPRSAPARSASPSAAEAPAREALAAQRSTRGARRAARRFEEAAPADAMEADDAPTEAMAAAPAPSGAAERLDALRAQAFPVTLPPPPAPDAPQEAARLTAAEAARAAGDSALERSQLAPLLASRQPAVVQYAAYRTGRLLLAAGDPTGALAVVERALLVGAGDPAWRALLYAAQGQLREGQGDTAGAAESYRRAAAARR